jgi:hypothetical protein
VQPASPASQACSSRSRRRRWSPYEDAGVYDFHEVADAPAAEWAGGNGGGPRLADDAFTERLQAIAERTEQQGVAS